MQKPDKNDKKNKVELHHFQAHHGAEWLCEHSCKKNIEHNNKNFHDLQEEHKKLPKHQRAQEIVEHFLDELYSHDKNISSARYAAIYAQLIEAKRNLEKLSKRFAENLNTSDSLSFTITKNS